MTRRWVDYRLSVSPAMAPGNPKQEDELLFLRDKHYELDGEVMMFVIVAIFTIFILSLVVLPWLKRLSCREPEYSSSVTRRNFSSPWLMERRRMDDVSQEGSAAGESEVSRKPPH